MSGRWSTRRVRRMLWAFVVAAVVQLAWRAGAQDPPGAPAPMTRAAPHQRGGLERVLVVRAVDGDTFKVRAVPSADRPRDGAVGPRRHPGTASADLGDPVLGDGEEDTVRVIGADSPEIHRPGTPVQCFGREAAAYAARELVGREVLLERDVRLRDRWGRLLAYVWVGQPSPSEGVVRTQMFNARLISDGYAEVMAIPPDIRYADVFVRLEGEARSARRGLWGGCTR